MEDFMTVKEVANILRVSESTVRNYIKQGIIKAIKFGSNRRATVRIPKTEVEKFYSMDEAQDEEE
jgi:excisionase family DNA binding protein